MLLWWGFDHYIYHYDVISHHYQKLCPHALVFVEWSKELAYSDYECESFQYFFSFPPRKCDPIMEVLLTLQLSHSQQPDDDRLASWWNILLFPDRHQFQISSIIVIAPDYKFYILFLISLSTVNCFYIFVISITSLMESCVLHASLCIQFSCIFTLT